MNKKNFDEAIYYTLKKIEDNLEVFTKDFPVAVSENLIYYPIKNKGYDTGFWTAMLWLAYEISGDEKYRHAAEIQIESYKERLEKNIDTNCILLGRIYSLSCVASYKATGDERARNTAIRAADKLVERYTERGQFINCWDKPENSKTILIEMPSLIDLPLLYWAAQETGNKSYYNTAVKHLNKVLKHNIREDGSTFHQFFFDSITGEPLHGTSLAGYSDKSCWSRGHVLGIYGLVLNYIYTGDVDLLKYAKETANYFLSRLPEDGICCWDLIFKEGEESRDTSSAAIAASALLELARYLPVMDQDKYIYEATAMKILSKLIKDYTTNNEEYSDSNGILMGGVYRKLSGYGENECMLIGEYFYFEALIKATRCLRLFW